MQIQAIHGSMAVLILFVHAFSAFGFAQDGDTLQQPSNEIDTPWNLLTPHTAINKGFSFETRFVDKTETSKGITTRTGLLSVQIIFDSNKGPKINEAIGAQLRVKKDDNILVLVPIETARHRETGKIQWMQLSLNDETLPNSDILLNFIDGNHAYEYVIPLNTIYKLQLK